MALLPASIDRRTARLCHIMVSVAMTQLIGRFRRSLSNLGRMTHMAPALRIRGAPSSETGRGPDERTDLGLVGAAVDQSLDPTFEVDGGVLVDRRRRPEGSGPCGRGHE